MPITINGAGSIVGISAGGLPDASVTPADLTQPLTLATSQAATGTFVDFTGIPSWVKRVTVMFDGVSLSGSALLVAQIGDSGGIETTGYSSASFGGVNGNVVSGGTGASTWYLLTAIGSASYPFSGIATFANVSGNTWIGSGSLAAPGSAAGWSFGGTKTLSATLDRIRLTTTSTDTFDAGSINILYE